MKIQIWGALFVMLMAAAPIQDVSANLISTGDLLDRCYYGYMRTADSIGDSKDAAVLFSNNNVRKACYQSVAQAIFNKNRIESYKWTNAAAALPQLALPGTTSGARKMLQKRGLLTSTCSDTAVTFNWVGSTGAGSTNKASKPYTQDGVTVTVRAYKANTDAPNQASSIGTTWTTTTSTGIIYEKNSGGEIGLGMTAGTSGGGTSSNELGKSQFLQLEIPAEWDVVNIPIDSLQKDETVAIWGSNTEGAPGQLLFKAVGTGPGTSGPDVRVTAPGLVGPGKGGPKYFSISALSGPTNANDVLVQNGLVLVKKCTPPNTDPGYLCASHCADPDFILLPGELSRCGTLNPCDCCSAGIAFGTNVLLNLAERVNVSKVFNTAVSSRGVAAMAVCQADLIVGPNGFEGAGGTTQCTTATQIDVVSGVASSTSSSITTYDPSNGQVRATSAGELPIDTTLTPGSEPVTIQAPTCAVEAVATTPAHSTTCPLGQAPCCTLKFPRAVGDLIQDSCNMADPMSYCDVSADKNPDCSNLATCAGCQCVS